MLGVGVKGGGGSARERKIHLCNAHPCPSSLSLPSFAPKDIGSCRSMCQRVTLPPMGWDPRLSRGSQKMAKKVQRLHLSGTPNYNGK